MRLRYKFTLFFLVIVLGPIIGLGLMTTRLIGQAMVHSARETLEHDMQMAWAEYWSRGQQMRMGMLQAAVEPSIQEMVRQRDSEALRRLMRAWKTHRPYVDLWLVTDPTGRVIARLNSDRAGDHFPLNDLIATATERREAILSSEILPSEFLAEEGLAVPNAQAGLAVIVTTPVLCDGSVCGLIITGDLLHNDPYVPNALQQKLHGHQQHTVAGADLHRPLIFISSGETIVTTSLQPSSGVPSMSALMPEEVSAQTAGGLPYRGKTTIRGIPYLLAVDPIRNDSGQVIGTLSIGLPEQLFRGLRGEAIRAVIASLLLGAVLAAVVAMLLGARMAYPLRELATKAQAVAAGNLDVQVPVQGTDEIGELGRAFNRMVQELRTSYGRLAEEQSKVIAAIEASQDAIWISDADQRLVTVNSALERLVGQRRADLLGQTCRHRFNVRTHDGASICDTSCPFLNPTRRQGKVEGCIPTASGQDAWVEISYGHITNTDGELVGVVHIVHDLTERKEVERLKDEFISMVSHELRTPLHHIKGFATTLLQTDVEWDAATQRDFLESINREADRLSNLVGKILHLSRLEADGLPMEREWCLVNDLMDRVLRRRRNLIADRPVHLHLEPDLPALYVDEREIEVVLINLIENAVKYSFPGTPITLSVHRRADQVIFSVADQGIGIPPEHQERIFERFYRVNGARRVAGTGLGLAICKRIVEAHGGRIWVESKPGVGSCFQFSLPVQRADEENAHSRCG